MSYRRSVRFGLLIVALGASGSAPAAMTLATCLPLDAISASPRVTVEAPVEEPCAADWASPPASGRTPEITRC